MRCSSYEATWAFFDGDLETALTLATNGLGDDDDRCAIQCHQLAAIMLFASGRTSEAVERVPVLRSLLNTTSEPFARNVLAFGIAQITAGHPGADGDIQVALDSARLVGADQSSSAIRMRALQRLHADNDVDGALGDNREAVRLTESVGATSAWAEHGVAITLIAGRRPEARRELRRIIAAAYDERMWIVIDTLLELPPFVLRSSDPEAAAIVFGYCELRAPSWGDAAQLLREQTARRVAANPNSAALRARGAAMDRHEIVAFTLAALAEP